MNAVCTVLDCLLFDFFEVFIVNKLNINVQDQFGANYAIEATLDDVVSSAVKTYERIKYIIVDKELIRPSFEMFFQSVNSGKIFKII